MVVKKIEKKMWVISLYILFPTTTPTTLLSAFNDAILQDEELQEIHKGVFPYWRWEGGAEAKWDGWKGGAEAKWDGWKGLWCSLLEDVCFHAGGIVWR